MASRRVVKKRTKVFMSWFGEWLSVVWCGEGVCVVVLVW